MQSTLYKRLKNKNNLKWLSVPVVAFFLIVISRQIFALLPQSDAPLWFTASLALSGAGLAVYFCMTDRTYRKAKTKDRWGLRLFVVFCVSVLVTLSIELAVFNLRSFITRNDSPTELALYDFCYADTEDFVNEDGSSIVFESTTSAQTTSIEHLGIYEEVQTVKLSFEGDSVPIQVQVYTRDEASAYYYWLVYTTTFMPQVDDLSDLSIPVYSEGSLLDLKLAIKLPANSTVQLASVELNTQVPVIWQPIRMILLWVLCMLILCALRMPWRDIIYCANKPSHKLVLFTPLVMLLALTILCALWILPADERGSLVSSVSLEEAAANTKDPYGILFTAFQKGQLHLDYEPSETLMLLQNPYDTSERAACFAPHLTDYVFYNNQYYVYFGLAPLLLVYYPYYIFTGQLPSEAFCGCILTMLAIIAIYFAVLGFVRRFGKSVNLFILTLLCVATVFASGGSILMTASERYTNVASAYFASMAACIGFGFYAFTAKKAWKRTALFILCGLCFAMQLMSRPNTVLLTTAILAPSFISILLSKETTRISKWQDASAFLVPALCGVAVVMWYNAARYGSVFDFGNLYQTAELNVNQKSLQPSHLFQGFWYYLFALPGFTAYFPYLQLPAVSSLINLSGTSLFLKQCIGIFAYPLMWSLPMIGLCFKRFEGDALSTRIQVKASTIIPLVISLPLIIFSFHSAGVLMRYVTDYQLTYALIAAFSCLMICGDGAMRDAYHSTLRNIVIALVIACIILGILLLFESAYPLIKINSPDLFYRLKQMLPPYTP